MTTPTPEPEKSCTRCGIKKPLVFSVLHDPLCANCELLRQNYRDEFSKPPTYGPLPEPAGTATPHRDGFGKG